MILDQFLYFAQYPSKDGVRAILTNGASDFPGYNDLAESLDKLPNVSRLPEIANYVYGQSFEELSKHPKIAVLPLHKKPLYDWLHIRVLCYL